MWTIDHDIEILTFFMKLNLINDELLEIPF